MLYTQELKYMERLLLTHRTFFVIFGALLQDGRSFNELSTPLPGWPGSLT